ncbi:MAG TPA: Crp/Fnr family transcriptional regulator [Cyclobacteriaceae bacterium]|nr:Crp/Fnr family transcriptional regulator [Cyclobacteriaceae bacterium]
MKPKPEHFPTFRKHLEQFVKLDDREFEAILNFFTVKRLKKRQFLVNAGNKVKHTHWVKKGMLTSNYTDPEGKEHVIQFAMENCWITDQNAFYNQGDAIFDILCVEDCELLCITFDDREKLCAEVHKMANFFRKKANDSFVKQQKRLLSYLSSDAKKRYELLLAEYPPFIHRLPKKVLAAYLGVSRETLSRFGK